MQEHKLQVSVHDWTSEPTVVWTKEQGHLCPQLESPKPGEVVLYVDYQMDVDEILVQARVEMAIDGLGYPAGPRWIGRSSKDVDAVVSLVSIIPGVELDQHIERVQSVVSKKFLAIFDGKEHQPIGV